MLNKYFTKKSSFLVLASLFANFGQSVFVTKTLGSEHITQCLEQHLPHLKFIPVEVSVENYQQRALDIYKLNTFNKKVQDLMRDYSTKVSSDKDVRSAAYSIMSHFQDKYNELRAESLQLSNEDFRWKFGSLFCLPHRFIFYLQKDAEARKYNDDLFAIINSTYIQRVAEMDASATSLPAEPYSENLFEDDINFILNLFTLKYTRDAHLKCGTLAVEFKLPLLIARLTTDPHFQNYLFTYFEHAWTEIEKSFDVHGIQYYKNSLPNKRHFLTL